MAEDNLAEENLDSVERHLRSVTDEDVARSQAEREVGPELEAEAAQAVTESTPLTGKWQDLISRKAYDFIVRWETGGRAYYERVIKRAPVWPGYASGITIGCGYDLGYHTRAQLHADWGSRLPAADIGRLEPAIGFRTTQPNRERKVVRARQFVSALRDIEISWDVAIEQFDSSKMPNLLGQLYRSLSRLDRLHPHCRGALLSLVFNRGASFAASGDRYREMRAIAALMNAGGRTDFAAIPAEIRSMKRIWGADSSLAARREGEALLFEEGLRAAAVAGAVAEFAAVARGEAEAAHLPAVASLGPEPTEDVTGGFDEGPGDRAVESFEDDAESARTLARLTPAEVRWSSDDARQPDYAHLEGAPVGATFQLVAEDIETLIRANRFRPRASPGRAADEAKIVILLRGAKLVGGDNVADATALPLIDQRPDHRDFRCVIGVYDRKSGRFDAFRASTVPNAENVHKCYSVASNPAKWYGNILPTGCYTFTVGTHRAGDVDRNGVNHEIRGVLRLSTTAAGASQVVVLRSLTDVVYDTMDHWQITAPADNIHPAKRRRGFSSAGCMTLPGDGSVADSSHTDLWLAFREALEIPPSGHDHDGKQFSGVLLTGLDAAAAADLRARGVTDPGEIDDRLARLRHGSIGAEVGKLQAALGVTPDTVPTMGPKTRAALIERQQAALGFADGILSPRMARRLGLDIF